MFLTANVKAGEDQQARTSADHRAGRRRPSSLRSRAPPGASAGRTGATAVSVHSPRLCAVLCFRPCCPLRPDWRPPTTTTPRRSTMWAATSTISSRCRPRRGAFFWVTSRARVSNAAVVTGLTRYTLRAAAVYDDDPVQVLHNLNTVLYQQLQSTDPVVHADLWEINRARQRYLTSSSPAGGTRRRCCSKPTEAPTTSTPLAAKPQASRPSRASWRTGFISHLATHWCSIRTA